VRSHPHHCFIDDMLLQIKVMFVSHLTLTLNLTFDLFNWKFQHCSYSSPGERSRLLQFFYASLSQI